MSRRALAALVLVLVLFGLGRPAAAHVVVTAELVQQTLARVNALKAAANAADTGDAERAQALYDLGDVLARTTDALNRDIATHDGTPSLEAQALVAQLAARGYPIQYSDELARYRHPLEVLEAALALAPEDPRAADARFSLLATRFYESFAADPYALVGMDLAGLLANMDAAAAFLAAYPNHRAYDEAEFILAVDYARASKLMDDEAARQDYRQKALDALSAYVHGHAPNDLRAATARLLLEDLEQ